MDAAPMVLEPFAEATPSLSEETLALAARGTDAMGGAVLSEGPRLRLQAGSGAPCGISAVRTGTGGPLVGAAVGVGPPEPGGPDVVWTVEVVSPAASGLPPSVVARLVADACAGACRHGATTAMLWQPVGGPPLEAIAPASFRSTERRLVELRRTLPVPEVRRSPGVPVRAFRPGSDEASWVAANNRAFAGHPEQGNWTVDQVRSREQEAWFDPQGFLVLEDGDGIGGACWTKIHPDSAPPLGEIYVIFVDPRLHGRGLGRALLDAGLTSLHDRGAHVAMLHVEADNEPALALYRSAGFAVHHVQRALRIDLASEP
ncbi:MAG: mycothiol synthase [Actinomycetota bacterium]|nr:mycothiol synthase [Actinomycetota bacterium]